MANDDLLLKMVSLTSIFFPLFIIGVLCADKFFYLKHGVVSKWVDKEFVPLCPNKDEPLIPFIIIIFFVCFAVFCVYLRYLPMIPLFAAFNDSGKSAMALRAMAVGELFEGGKIWWYKYFYAYFPMLLSYIVFLETLRYRTFKWFFTAVILISYCIFINIFDAQKAPFILYLFSLFLVYYIHKQNQKYFTVKLMTWSGLICFLFIIIMYIHFMNRTYLEAIFESLHRLFTGQLIGLYGIIEKFSDHPLLGRTFPPSILKIFGVEFYHLDMEMKAYMSNYINASSAYIGLAPTVYYGEVFANFGTLTCLFSMFLVPFFLRIAEIIITTKFVKNYIIGGFYIFCIIHFLNLSGGRLFSMIIDTALFLSFGVVFLLYTYKHVLIKLAKKA